MKNKKPFAIVVECVSTCKWDIVVAGWSIGGMMTKESAEHCARDINMVHDDAILGAVAERDARIAELSRLLERIERERTVHSDVWSRDMTTEIRKALGKGE